METHGQCLFSLDTKTRVKFSHSDGFLSFAPMLPPPASSSSVYQLYGRRFYVLFTFAFLAFNQCLFWLTFSPISRNTQAYYQISEIEVNLLLNWGPIIFIPCLPFTYLLLNKRNGLQRCVVLLALTDFLAALIRIGPLMTMSPASPAFTPISRLCIHTGQILNAACGPLVMAPVSQLSSLWFGPNERTRATTLAILANSFGSTIGFLISPWIVDAPERVSHLLYLHFCLAALAALLVMAYFPAEPPSPPSPATRVLIDHTYTHAQVNSLRSYMESLWQCCKNPSFILLCSIGGVLGGAFAAWTSLFANILAAENFNERQAGRTSRQRLALLCCL